MSIYCETCFQRSASERLCNSESTEGGSSKLSLSPSSPPHGSHSPGLLPQLSGTNHEPKAPAINRRNSKYKSTANSDYCPGFPDMALVNEDNAMESVSGSDWTDGLVRGTERMELGGGSAVLPSQESAVETKPELKGDGLSEKEQEASKATTCDRETKHAVQCTAKIDSLTALDTKKVIVDRPAMRCNGAVEKSTTKAERASKYSVGGYSKKRLSLSSVDSSRGNAGIKGCCLII